MQEPTICRIVKYRTETGEDVPALITALDGPPGVVDLTVFMPGSIEFASGVELAPTLPDGGVDALTEDERADYEASLPGKWRWPERETAGTTGKGGNGAQAAEKAEKATETATA